MGGPNSIRIANKQLQPAISRLGQGHLRAFIIILLEGLEDQLWDLHA